MSLVRSGPLSGVGSGASAPGRAVIPELVEQHFEDLDFLWELREARIFAIDWDLVDLAAHEARAEAHLDALHLAGAPALALARRWLTGPAPFAAAAATFVLLDAQSPDLARELLDAFADAGEPALDGMRRALRHCRLDGLLEPLEKLAAAGPPLRRAAACDVLAFQRRPLPETFPELLEVPASDVRRLALAAGARLGSAPTSAQLEAALADPDPLLRHQALESAARTRMPGLVERCRAALAEPGDARLERIEWLGIAGAPRDAEALLARAGDADSAIASAALRALAALGAPASVAPLLELLEHPLHAREASLALSRVTGFAAGERLEPDPDEPDAPPPRLDAQAARRHWAAREAPAREPERLQLGRDASAPLGPVFTELPLAVRRDLYLGACARGGATPVPDLELERRAPLQSLPASARSLEASRRARRA